MNLFCAEKGILHQFSSVRTPQQNGVAKRRNRTLIDAARTFLCDSKLPVIFWAEAINTACYVQNRVLLNKKQMKTPYEVVYGHKPTVAYFRIYSDLSYYDLDFKYLFILKTIIIIFKGCFKELNISRKILGVTEIEELVLRRE